MFRQGTFELFPNDQQEKYIPLVQRPLYLPIEQKDLQIGNHSLSLVKVTPEEVILKYLGYKNYEQKVD